MLGRFLVLFRSSESSLFLLLSEQLLEFLKGVHIFCRLEQELPIGLGIGARVPWRG